MFKAALVAVLALAPGVFAQEAKIMIVDREDSQKLAKSYREYQDARKHWEDAKADVSKRYTVQAGKTIEGWEKVQFSFDFRAIVPESSEYARRPGTGCLTWSGTTLAVPASGVSSGTLSVWPAPPEVESTLTNHTFSTDGVRPDVTVKEKR